MKRKLVATGVAFIVAIPLIPLIRKDAERLTGNDPATVFPAQGWNIVRQSAGGQETAVAVPASSTSSSFNVSAGDYASVYGVPPKSDGLWLPENWRLKTCAPALKFTPADLAAQILTLPAGHVTASCSAAPPFSAGAVARGFWIDQMNGQDLDVAVASYRLVADGSYEFSEPIYAYSDRTALATFKNWSHTRTALEVDFSHDSAALARAPEVRISKSPALASTNPGTSIILSDTGASMTVPKSLEKDGLAPLSITNHSKLAQHVSLGQTATLSSGESYGSSGEPSLAVSLTSGSSSPQELAWTLSYASQNLASVDSASARLSPNLSPSEASSTQYISSRPTAPKAQRVEESGWYALDVGGGQSRAAAVQVEFVPDGSGERRCFMLRNGGGGGKQAGWIHFKEPGAVVIRASEEEPSLHGLGFAEFFTRAGYMTWSKTLLTVFLLEEIFPLCAWIFIVWQIRRFAYRAIMRLPRTEREHARHEVNLMLNFAKWSGVGCYVLWTAKDILAGVGIVFAG